MTTKLHGYYLKFLATGYTPLLLSRHHFEEYDLLRGFFDKSLQRDINDKELDNLSATLINSKIDIVIVDFIQYYDLAYKMYKKLLSYDEKIITIVILPKELNNGMIELMESANAVLFEGFSLEQLKDKIVTQLSILYTIKSVGRRDVIIDLGSQELADGENESFFDTYEGSSLFIVDELIEYNKSLKNGELSGELLEKIAKKLRSIAEIFAHNTSVENLADVYKDLATYLQELDLSTIKPDKLYAFDYICSLNDDTCNYIMNMFVDRVIKNSYIIKDSIENNVKFMKRVLSDENAEDESELEFF